MASFARYSLLTVVVCIALAHHGLDTNTFALDAYANFVLVERVCFAIYASSSPQLYSHFHLYFIAPISAPIAFAHIQVPAESECTVEHEAFVVYACTEARSSSPAAAGACEDGYRILVAYSS